MTPSSANRRLAAVMFADMAGYTDGANRDESRTLDRRRRFMDLAGMAIRDHSGRVVKTLGDGVLAEFLSAADAVRCGLHLREALSTEPAIPARVGIHAGDVVDDERDVLGNTVNLAARLQQACTPGQVAVSGEVMALVRPLLSLRAEPIPAEALGRLPQPATAYCVYRSGEGE